MTHTRQRSIWTKPVVETLWAAMRANMRLRVRGQAEAWWALIARAVNERHGLHVTGKACGNKASEVAGLGRPYPWDESDDEPDTATAPLELSVVERIDRLEATLTDLISDLARSRVMPTHDVTPAVNQLWVSRAARDSGHHVPMRVESLDDTHVTLIEVGGGQSTVAITRESLTQHFAHIGFAHTSPPVPAVAPTPTPANGHRDLSALLR